jgi:cobalamin transport system substrate-binding protein
MKASAFNLVLITLGLLMGASLILPHSLCAVERVVILNTAVSPILQQMDLDEKVVGVTYKDEVYTNRTRIGSHLSPNIELIRALQPDLIIAGSKRAFPVELARRMKSEVFRYDPRNLQEILDAVLQLGKRFQKEAKAREIVQRETEKLAGIKPFADPVSVVFEISQQPLKLAGRENIVNSIIEQAGGRNLISIERKHVLISPEKVLVLNPEIYLYQNGPMNKNPIPPGKRSVFRTLKSEIHEVDQLGYTRAGLNAFDAVVDLHQKFTHLKNSNQP